MGIYTAKALILPHHQRNAARCPQYSLKSVKIHIPDSNTVVWCPIPSADCLYAVAAGASEATCSISILGMAAPVPPRSVWRAFGFLV